MTTELKNLLALRSQAERKILHTELRNIAAQASAVGQHTGSRHVLAAVSAGATSITAFCQAAFEDYKAVVDVDRLRYKASRLNEIKKVFLEALRDEKRSMSNILEQKVGGIAKHLSPEGLAQYKQFDTEFVAAFNAADSKAELYNKKMLDAAPTFLSKAKAKAESSPITAIIVFVLFAAGAIKGLSEAYEVIQKALH